MRLMAVDVVQTRPRSDSRRNIDAGTTAGFEIFTPLFRLALVIVSFPSNSTMASQVTKLLMSYISSHVNLGEAQHELRGNRSVWIEDAERRRQAWIRFIYY